MKWAFFAWAAGICILQSHAVPHAAAESGAMLQAVAAAQSWSRMLYQYEGSGPHAHGASLQRCLAKRWQYLWGAHGAAAVLHMLPRELNTLTPRPNCHACNMDASLHCNAMQ